MLLLLACESPADDASSGLAGIGNDGAPVMRVSIPATDFGEVAVGQTVDVEATVLNEGDGSLQIYRLWVGDPFEISGITSVLLAPGATASFTVGFEPAEIGVAGADLGIWSNAGDLTIPLTAEGVAASLVVSPTELDFGAVALGCKAEERVRVQNQGSENERVAGATLSNDTSGFFVDTEVSAFLPPNTSADVDVAFEPEREGGRAASLVLETTEGPLAVSLAGQAYVVMQTDTWVVPEGEVDVLVVLDTSATMTERMDPIADQLEIFASNPGDWQLTVITEDDGCANGAWIDPSTADVTAALDTLMATEGAAYARMGFTLLENALAESTGCNAGFFRSGARLAVLGVTDDVEQSANPWSYYVSLTQGYYPDADDVSFWAVAGDYTTGCDDAEPGTGWYEATVATGGGFISICATDQATALAGILDPVEDGRFELSQWPLDADDIAVSVDGVPVDGWTYASTDRDVRFDETPGPGSVIEITYPVSGC